MRWLNPLSWITLLWAYVKKHFFAWHIAEGLTWVKVGMLSIAYPDWARDAWASIPVLWDHTLTTCKVLAEVCVDIFHNTS